MDFFLSENHKQMPKHQKKRLTQDQLKILETNFNYDKKLGEERKIQLSRKLGVPPRQVAIWYQNKRARWKTQTLELEYRALQLKYDSVATEKRRLEKEVEKLRGELQKTQDMLLGLMTLPASPHSSLSLFLEENSSPSLLSDASCHWENVEPLQMTKLHTCLMGKEKDPSTAKQIMNSTFFN